MKPLRPDMFRGLIAAMCVGTFAIYAFTYSGNAEASRNPANAQTQSAPSALDYSISERQLAKASRKSQLADRCAKGSIHGGTEIHVAMHFSMPDQPKTLDTPGFARAHVEKSAKDKALVIDSKDPTVWNISGAPSVIIVLGQAVLGKYPEGTKVFAPRFVNACRDEMWVKEPKRWGYPGKSVVMETLTDGLKRRFLNRSTVISEGMFNRPATTWRARRGAVMIKI